MPELRHRRFDHRLCVLWSRHVGGHRERAPAALLDQRAGVLEAIGAARGQHQIGAGFGQCPAEGDTQPGGGTGDDCHLPIEAETVQHRGRRHLWSSRQRAVDCYKSSCKLLLLG